VERMTITEKIRKRVSEGVCKETGCSTYSATGPSPSLCFRPVSVVTIWQTFMKELGSPTIILSRSVMGR
jgi:hypothetical protein